MSTAGTQQARIPISAAIDEITSRLKALRNRVTNVREDVTGECESSDAPEAIGERSLDGRVHELFPIVAQIEDELARIIVRLGVDTPRVKPTAAASGSLRGY